MDLTFLIYIFDFIFLWVWIPRFFLKHFIFFVKIITSSKQYLQFMDDNKLRYDSSDDDSSDESSDESDESSDSSSDNSSSESSDDISSAEELSSDIEFSDNDNYLLS